MQSRCTATRGCASALCDQQVAGVAARSPCSVGGPGHAALARDVPVGEQRQLAPQQRVVVGRQRRRAGTLLLPVHQRARSRRASARRRAPRRARASAAASQVELRAEVVEQQEAVRDVARQHARHVQAGCCIRPATCDERAHVLLRRRRVHHDAGCRPPARRCAGSGESSRRPTRAAGWRAQGRGGRRSGASQRSKAARRRASAQETASGTDGGVGRGGRGGVGGARDEGRATAGDGGKALVDNRILQTAASAARAVRTGASTTRCKRCLPLCHVALRPFLSLLKPVAYPRCRWRRCWPAPARRRRAGAAAQPPSTPNAARNRPPVDAPRPAGARRAARAARQLPIIAARATSCAAGPTSTPWPTATSSCSAARS